MSTGKAGNNAKQQTGRKLNRGGDQEYSKLSNDDINTRRHRLVCAKIL